MANFNDTRFNAGKQTRSDTERADSRTFNRRSFVSPPRERIEDEADANARIDYATMPTFRDEHFVHEVKGEVAGGGLPSGYVETDFILCVNGSPVSGQILFKEA